MDFHLCAATCVTEGYGLRKTLGHRTCKRMPLFRCASTGASADSTYVGSSFHRRHTLPVSLQYAHACESSAASAPHTLDHTLHRLLICHIVQRHCLSAGHRCSCLGTGCTLHGGASEHVFLDLMTA